MKSPSLIRDGKDSKSNEREGDERKGMGSWRQGNKKLEKLIEENKMRAQHINEMKKENN